ncbi:hypothetical protein PoB_001594000 [Plakobranchus ocellatus]|uniref:ZP domain-containing protein n=1 Tax=Plakobranchus ocellatus TaxID=259542 RepID=A0AAV3Z216_9GAST|nr:hypothetical protein PoB_001594000 [Plakobranchus ocellatus]
MTLKYSATALAPIRPRAGLPLHWASPGPVQACHCIGPHQAPCRPGIFTSVNTRVPASMSLYDPTESTSVASWVDVHWRSSHPIHSRRLVLGVSCIPVSFCPCTRSLVAGAPRAVAASIPICTILLIVEGGFSHNPSVDPTLPMQLRFRNNTPVHLLPNDCYLHCNVNYCIS